MNTVKLTVQVVQTYCESKPGASVVLQAPRQSPDQTTDWKTRKQTAEDRTTKASENLFSGDARGFQTSDLSFVDQGQVTIILDCPVTSAQRQNDMKS